VAASVVIEFAKFLQEHQYSTEMWGSGYTSAESNGVCHDLTKWGQTTWQLPGEFLMLWSRSQDTQFLGDSELVYFINDLAYLLPNPFIEGDAEGFVLALATIVAENVESLYSVTIRQRVLYNAV
jgi:hypothetical protein